MTALFKLYLPIIFASVMLSCTDNKQGAEMSETYYFDLTDFVDQTANQFSGGVRVQKTVILNESKESQELESYNISGELELMKSLEINKPSLAGKYDIREIQLQDTIKTIYTALEEDLKTRSLTVNTKDGKVVKIILAGQQKSLLSESKQSIIFEPEKSYHLISTDNNRFGKTLRKEILINFL